MTRQSLRRRIERLEKLDQAKDKSIIVITQSLDDPTLYRINGDPGCLLPEIKASDYQAYAMASQVNGGLSRT